MPDSLRVPEVAPRRLDSIPRASQPGGGRGRRGRAGAGAPRTGPPAAVSLRAEMFYSDSA